MKRFPCAVVAVSSAAILLSACKPASPDQPEGADPAESRPAFDGLWYSKLDDGRELWFLVRHDEVKWLDRMIVVPEACAVIGAMPGMHHQRVTMQGQALIVDGVASDEQAGPPARGKFAVKFESNDAAAGTYERHADKLPDDDSPAECAAPESLSFTARRPTRAELEASWLSRKDLLLAQEQGIAPRPADGVWAGTTSDGVPLRFLVMDNALRWVQTEKALPASCKNVEGAWDKAGANPYPTVLAARLSAGRLAWSMVDPGGYGAEVRMALEGQLGGDQGQGRLVYHVSRPANEWGQKACSFDWQATWSAARLPLAEARSVGHLSVAERFALGEDFKLIKSIELGSVAGGKDCDTMRFTPAQRPYRLPAGGPTVAYRMVFDTEGAQLLEEVAHRIDGSPGFPAWENFSCMKHDEVLGSNMVTGIPSSGGPYSSGSYRLHVVINDGDGTLPGVEEAFDITP